MMAFVHLVACLQGRINVSTVLPSAAPQEFILDWFLCDEYSAAGLLPSLLVQVQNVVSWHGTSAQLPQARLFRLRHRNALYSLFLNSFLGILQCFIKTLSLLYSPVRYCFSSVCASAAPFPSSAS